MAFQSVPNVALCQVFGKVDGQDTINDVSFLKPGGGIDVANLTNLANLVSAWYTAAIVGALSEAWSLVRTVATDLTTQTGPRVEIPASGVNGGQTGEPAPNNVAFCIKFLTAQRGRNFRGRNYVPALANADVDVNTLAASTADDLRNGYAELLPLGTFDPDPYQWVVVSRFFVGSARPVGIATQVIGTGYTDLTVDSMRSRLPGRGK